MRQKGDIMKRTIALILAGLLCMSAFAGCSESTDNSDVKSDDTTNAVSADGEEEEAVPERLYANIPADASFDGYEFTVLCSSNSEHSVNQNDFHAEELTGEVINDARYNRNITISDKLKISIVDTEPPVGSDNGKNYVMNDVKAGTGAYDLATLCGYATSVLSTGNYLLDMNTIPYIELNQPWWDQKANEDLTILGQLFYTTGELTTSDNDATYCIMFNKQLIQDYNLGNPYELVDNGTWTMDKFIDMASQVSSDLDGNGKFDQMDRYGALIWDDSMMGVVNCTGEKCCTIGTDGLLSLTLNTETTIDVITKFLDFACQKDIACAYQRLNWDDSLLVNMFSGDQSLFLMQLIQIVPKMREMDTDFGILPYFKYTETQNKYYTTIGSWHSVFVCIPNCQEDVTRTGIITEALSNESLYGLTEAYYEKTLKGKTTRDVESVAMLDIIFATRVYDMGWYFQIGGFNEQVMNLLRNYTNDFSSMYKKNEKAAKKVLEKTNKSFVEAKEQISG